MPLFIRLGFIKEKEIVMSYGFGLGNRRDGEGIHRTYSGMTPIGFNNENRKRKPDRFIDVKLRIVDDERWTRHGTIHTGDRVSCTFYEVPHSGIVLGFRDGKANCGGYSRGYTVMMLLEDDGRITESDYLELLDEIEIKKGV